jgi:hypothetical protein
LAFKSEREAQELEIPLSTLLLCTDGAQQTKQCGNYLLVFFPVWLYS